MIQYDLPRMLNDWCGTQFLPGEEREHYQFTCPFHNDHTPSMYMKCDGSFRCMACGTKGSWVFQFAARRWNIAPRKWMDVLDTLYPYYPGKSGETLPPELLQERLKIKQELLEKRAKENLLSAQAYAQGNFAGDELAYPTWTYIDSPGKIYMCGRGFLSTTMQHFHVTDWQRFPYHPLLIPCLFNDSIYGYIQKAISKYASPRFLTMPGMKTAEHIYGYAPLSKRKKKKVRIGIVFEGFTDQFMAWQHGFTLEKGYASFVILGASVSSAQAAMMALHCDILLSGFDNDAAGDSAHATLLQEMTPYSVRIHRVRWPTKDAALCTRHEFWQAIGASVTLSSPRFSSP